jgi:hypothetical protein
VLDLGEEPTLKGLVPVPRSDAGAAGFPRDFTVQIGLESGKYTTVATFTNCPAPDASGLLIDLYTVIGYPKVRYIKIAATRLGPPPIDETDVYRLQLERVKILKQ